MSNPSNNYCNQEPLPAPVSSQGYAPPAPGGSYQGQGQYSGYQQPQRQPYEQQPYGQPQGGGYSATSPGYGPPPGTDTFGPPASGGFQHGQEGSQFGMYTASNPQGNAGYFGEAESRAGQTQQAPYDPTAQPNTYGNAADPDAPFDPNAPEGERGIRHALVGGTTGYIVGHKSGHGLVGAVGGALVGNFLGEERHKMRQHIRTSWGGDTSGGQGGDSYSSSSGGHHGSHHHSHHSSRD